MGHKFVIFILLWISQWSNLLFLPPYYSETLGRFEKDVSELFNLTSRYGLYNITYGTKFKKYYSKK
jgi:hypothetical protein